MGRKKNRKSITEEEQVSAASSVAGDFASESLFEDAGALSEGLLQTASSSSENADESNKLPSESEMTIVESAGEEAYVNTSLETAPTEATIENTSVFSEPTSVALKASNGESANSSTQNSTTTKRSSNMAISMSKYVSINSQFPEGAVAERSFGGLVFTPTEMLADADSTIKESYDAGERVSLTLTQVQSCFGVDSYEYNFAIGYYGYYSPSGTFASRLSFAKVLSTVTVYATAKAYAVGDYISNEIEITFTTYAANTAYNVGDYVKNSNTNYICTSAVTTTENTGWDAVSSKFTVTEDTTVTKKYKCTTAVTATENTGWTAVSSKFTETTDSPTVTPVVAFTTLLTKNDMFGSFTFLNGKGDTARVFSMSELKDVATLVTSSNEEGGISQRFLFVVNDVRGDQTASAVVTKKAEFNSCQGTVFISGNDAWSAFMPMAIFAAVDYESGTVVQHMFRQFSKETPSVQGDADYTTLTNGGVNFYGRTQCNGTTFDFYQRGVNTNGVDTGVYCNEVWFKSACGKSLMTYLIAQERIPANSFGVAMVRSRVLEICHTAVSNGSFMVKDVSATQQEDIRQIVVAMGGTTNDVESVVSDVSTQGYSVIASLGTDSNGEYYCHYYVFYGSGDSIKFIKGDDVLLK